MMRFTIGLFAAVLFLALTPSAVPLDAPSPQTLGSTAGVFTMSVSGTCPGLVTIDITSGTPFGRVGIAYSTSLGSFTIPSGPCAGTVLGLDSPIVLTTLNTDAAGDATFVGTAPASACGNFLQAVDLLPCLPSTVELVPWGTGIRQNPGSLLGIRSPIPISSARLAGWAEDLFLRPVPPFPHSPDLHGSRRDDKIFLRAVRSRHFLRR